jgi:nucleotide-binding universal stress UspA family protein
MKTARSILYASDLSPASKPALDRAIDMAKINRAKLTIVHVMSPVVPMFGDGYMSPKVWDGLEERVKRRTRQELDKLVTKAKTAGVPVTPVVMESTRPADRILELARSKRPGLIVMGTHGRRGLAKMFLGSVAQRVAAASPCPVMTVRGR